MPARPLARLALAALLLGGCASKQVAAPETTPPSLPDLVEARAPGVVRVEVPGGFGSGFVVDGGGLVVTSYHVVAGADAAEIVLPGDRRLPVTAVVASDELHDLAVLEVPARDLTSLPIGRSEALRPGEAVFTISSPFGMLDHTVTDGLISSVRGLTDLRLLQISAPISEGSSGGPLLNHRGEVIGVTTLIVSGGQNLNFAVPIEYLAPLLRARRREAMPAFARRTSQAEDAATVAAAITLPAAMLAGCSDEVRAEFVAALHDALRIGAPLCDADDHEACYRIYEGAGLGLSLGVRDDDCAGVREFVRASIVDARPLERRERAAALRELLAAVAGALVGGDMSEETEGLHVTPSRLADDERAAQGDARAQ
ncbi:MAG: trypsin-like peptidase domain-containing protein [Myxococcales bacterium]|nr:trypsin-like peptidase domain-containing protein [Myxococcales bacterium]